MISINAELLRRFAECNKTVPEKMLLDYPTTDLLAAIEGRELTTAQTKGVARLFGGWTFSQQRPKDGSLLPDELKARLLRHSLASTSEGVRSERSGKSRP